MAITYTATSNPGGLTGTALDGLPIEVTGLTLGTPYTFTVTATADVVGAASAASASVTPIVYEGKLYTWGNNAVGQLGDGTVINRSSPVQVGAGTKWLKISSGNYHSLAQKTDGTLWSWGYNAYGQLGDGTGIHRSSPVQIGTDTDWSNLYSRRYQNFVTKKNGTLWAWGMNNSFKLGLGDEVNRNLPVQIGALTTWLKIGSGAYSGLATKTDGSLWAWGSNQQGQLGNNSGMYTVATVPIRIGTETTWKNIASSTGSRFCMATKSNGTLWTWGDNGYKSLGLGDSTNRFVPTQVGTGTTWNGVFATDYAALATKTDGTLWAWGYNSNGESGLGDVTSDATHRNSPVQVGTLTNWSKIICGSGHVFAIKTDGTLWSWGRNDTGQLRQGNTINRSSPVQVGALTSWLTAVVSSGGGTAVAVLRAS